MIDRVVCHKNAALHHARHQCFIATAIDFLLSVEKAEGDVFAARQVIQSIPVNKLDNVTDAILAQVTLQAFEQNLLAAFPRSRFDALVVSMMRVLHIHDHPLALLVTHHEMHEPLFPVFRGED